MLPGTGNSVADYRVIKQRCRTCEGQGEVWIGTPGDLRWYLSGKNLSFGERRALVKEYRSNGGFIRCPDCGGSGWIEVWQ